ncbi:MAG TPA: STAS domain-containing protein [Rudaea sp.]|jgi:anti-sigma B factor antagonist|uniref:STAS domain-containing protein n=1 Tax=Rudaea sp. TaxID=2136325 RepID=UPI002F941FD0
MGLDIAQEQEGAARVLALRGRLDTDTAADMELALQDLLAAGEHDFLIDLSGVIYVSSAGLRVLLALAKRLDGGKGSLRLCGLNASVMQVFEVAGFSKLFAIFKDRATALAGMAKAAPAAQSPSLAQQVARLLHIGDYTSPASPQALELARAAAQLLGVKPIPMPVPATAPHSALPTFAADVRPPRPQARGLFARLRGLFGRN